MERHDGLAQANPHSCAAPLILLPNRRVRQRLMQTEVVAMITDWAAQRLRSASQVSSFPPPPSVLVFYQPLTLC